MRKRRIAIVCGSITAVLAIGAVSTFAVEGGLDLGFDGDIGPGNGKVTTDINNLNQKAYAVANAGDGGFFVAGVNGTGDFALVRYNSNGSRTVDFGAVGIRTTDFGGARTDEAKAIAVQTDEKIVVAGYATNANGNKDFAMARYAMDGTPEWSVVTNLTNALTGFGNSVDDEIRAIGIQQDGKIIVAGITERVSGGATEFVVARYNPDGTLDSSFGGDGVVGTDVGASTASEANALTIQEDGKIVVAGSSTTALAVVRYNSDGSLDTAFDGSDPLNPANGIVTTTVQSAAIGYAVQLQGDGKIVVAGYYTAFVTLDPFVVRYNTDGSLDTRFDGSNVQNPANGILYVSASVGKDVITSLRIQDDDKIVVGGVTYYDSTRGDEKNFFVLRLNADGSYDSTFNGNGVAITDFTAGANSRLDTAYGMAIQPDGDIVLVGESVNSGDADFALARYVGDEAAPTVSITRSGNGALLAGDSEVLTFTLSEIATTFEESDVTVENGTLSNFSGSGKTFTATLTPIAKAKGSIVVGISAGTFSDKASNLNVAATRLSIEFDTTIAGGTTPPDSTRVTPALRVKKTVTIRSIAVYAGLEVPVRSSISAKIIRASLKRCSLAGTKKIKGIRAGNCRLKITVRTKEGVTRSRAVTIPVLRR